MSSIATILSAPKAEWQECPNIGHKIVPQSLLYIFFATPYRDLW